MNVGQIIRRAKPHLFKDGGRWYCGNRDFRWAMGSTPREAWLKWISSIPARAYARA